MFEGREARPFGRGDGDAAAACTGRGAAAGTRGAKLAAKLVPGLSDPDGTGVLRAPGLVRDEPGSDIEEVCTSSGPPGGSSLPVLLPRDTCGGSSVVVDPICCRLLCRRRLFRSRPSGWPTGSRSC